MKLELRDELAARVAAALADGDRSPRDIAIRAYAVADALLVERGEIPLPDAVFELALEADPGPTHDPRWELEPRWSHDDARARDRAVARHDERGPGLASARPLPDGATKAG